MLKNQYKNANHLQQKCIDDFHKACLNGDFQSACVMIKNGVNLNVRFSNGQNLLHIACAKNFYGLVQLLIKFGCNEFLKDNFSRTCLHYSVLSNGTSIVRYLIEKNVFNSIDLMQTNMSDKENKNMLIKEFLNVQDCEGKTVLHLATQNKNYEIVKIILSATSNVNDLNIRDNDENTPLRLSIENGYLEITELLVRNGCDVDEMILKDICTKGKLSELNLLLKFSNDQKLLKQKLTSINNDSNTSYLYLALKSSFNLEFIRCLLDLGVKPIINDVCHLLDDINLHYISNESKLNSTEKIFKYYLECLIMLLKYKCFECLKISANSSQFSKFESYKKLNEYFSDYPVDEINASKILMIFIQIIYDLFKMTNDAQKNHQSKQRLIYLFALAIYSSQLNNRKQYVQKWMKKLAKNDLKELNSLLNDSLKNPWSLQMLCRVKIGNINEQKNSMRSIDVSNFSKLSKTCIRFINYEFI